MTRIPHTELDVYGLCLGGNVFGWTADRGQSFAVLDAYVEAGGNFIDTADGYSQWVPGNSGGESETVIGEWLAARGNRDRMIIATKVGKLRDRPGLSAQNIAAAVDDSLRRLGTDYIDLYYAHADDPDVEQTETLSAFDALVRAGKVRHIAASNYSGPRLSSALEISAREGLASYVALQPHYNLVERTEFEHELLPVAEANELAVFPYYGLAKGFLTGKYRCASDTSSDARRTKGAQAYLDERGHRVLAALDQVAAAQDSSPTAIALAWLSAQPTVAASIASARNLDQLPAMLTSTKLTLTADQLALLTKASS